MSGKREFDRERAARVLVDAFELGDEKAATKWGVTKRTIRNYRARLAEDPQLSSIFRAKGIEAEKGWHLTRTRFLRETVEHLRSLCLKAGTDQIDDVRKAVESVGNLDVASSALLNDPPCADPEGRTPPQDQGGGGQGQGTPSEADADPVH